MIRVLSLSRRRCASSLVCARALAKKAASTAASPSSKPTPVSKAAPTPSTTVATTRTATAGGGDHEQQQQQQHVSGDDMDANTARVIDEIVAKEPAFLQWFVQVYVPAVAETLGDIDDDSDFDSEQFVRDGYQQWAAAGKPYIEGPKFRS